MLTPKLRRRHIAAPWYTPSGAPGTQSSASSSVIRSEFSAIETALDKLPPFNASQIVRVNAGGTALETVSSISVAQGGTGVSTLTDGGILLGSGTSAITAMAVLADGEMIVGDGTTDPAIESGATLRTSIGLGTSDSPTFNAITGSGILSIDDTTDSTSVTTGSIHTDGGLGVAKNFHVNGDLVITDAVSNTNTKLGVGAGDVIESGAVNNTTFGNGSLGALTTSDNCTSIGFNTLNDCTASEITGVGSQALELLAAGTRLTAVGFRALSRITGGNFATAVGHDALRLLTGGNCVGVGDGALRSITGGSGCVAVGGSALQLTTGNNNTAVGNLSGLSLTTGSKCVLIGNSANVSTGAAVGQIVIGVAISCDQDDQITIGNSSGTMKNEFAEDNAWSQTSDIRKKRAIKNSKLGLSFINDLRPVTYKWKPANEFPVEWDIDPTTEINTDIIMTGLIAQEVEKALKKANVGIRFAGWREDRGDGQRISKEMFVFPLINAINELTSRIEKLELVGDLV